MMVLMIMNVVYLVEIITIANDIAGNIAINDDKTSYISELTTTHLVKQDDVGMTVVNGADTDIAHGDLLL